MSTRKHLTRKEAPSEEIVTSFVYLLDRNNEINRQNAGILSRIVSARQINMKARAGIISNIKQEESMQQKKRNALILADLRRQ